MQIILTATDGETSQAYAERLLSLIEQRQEFAWTVPGEDGEFQLYHQAYQFGEEEFAGLRLFFRRQESLAQGESSGNCVACHTPPQFTDQRFHNTGVSQIEYDDLFGKVVFESLEIPDLNTRNAQIETYLPASHEHPEALSRIRSVPSKQRPGFVDLEVWNVFANPDAPKPQAAITEIICATAILTN